MFEEVMIGQNKHWQVIRQGVDQHGQTHMHRLNSSQVAAHRSLMHRINS